MPAFTLLLLGLVSGASCGGKSVTLTGASGAGGSRAGDSASNPQNGNAPTTCDDLPGAAGEGLGGTLTSAGEPGTSEGGAITTGGTPQGGAGGTKAGGAGGSGGASSLPPVNGLCPPNSVKHPDGLCYCQPSTLTACADGCGDFSTDPDHCGACATKCGPTQACGGGSCGTKPKVVTEVEAGCGELRLALAGSRLYFSDALHGNVSSVTTTGAAPLEHATGQAHPTQILVNGGTLFWLANGGNSVMSVSSAGGSPQAVAYAASGINGFALSDDGKTLYFSADTKVNQTTAAPGGAPTEVGHEDFGIPHGLAVSGNQVLMPTDISGDLDVMTLVDGDPAVCASPDSATAVNHDCARLARGQGDLLFDTVFLAADRAYWVNGLDIETTSSSPPFGFNETIAQVSAPQAALLTAFTLHAGQTYFADDSGLIYGAPLMINANITALARQQLDVTSLVADDTHLYWAAGCAIMSLPLK